MVHAGHWNPYYPRTGARSGGIAAGAPGLVHDVPDQGWVREARASRSLLAERQEPAYESHVGEDEARLRGGGAHAPFVDVLQFEPCWRRICNESRKYVYFNYMTGEVRRELDAVTPYSEWF